MRQLARLFAAVALLAVAGACTTTETSGTANHRAAVSTVSLAPKPAEPVARPPAPPSAPTAHPGQLLGLKPPALTALLGSPRLVRREPPAQVWLYVNGGCAFHVYLYPATADGSYRVVHYDQVSRLRQNVADPRCFGRLLGHASERARNS